MKKKRFLCPLWDFVLQPQTQKDWGESLSCPDEFRRDSSLSSAECIMFDSHPCRGALWVGWDDGWQKCLPAAQLMWQRGHRGRAPSLRVSTALQRLLCLGRPGDWPHQVPFPHSHGGVLGTQGQGTRVRYGDLKTDCLVFGTQDRAQRRGPDGFAPSWFLRQCWAAALLATHCHVQLEAACTGWAPREKKVGTKPQPSVNQCEIKLLSTTSSAGWRQTLGVAVGAPGMWSPCPGRQTKGIAVTRCWQGNPEQLLWAGKAAWPPACFFPCLLFPSLCILPAWPALSPGAAHAGATQQLLVVEAKDSWAGEMWWAYWEERWVPSSEPRAGAASQAKSSSPTNKTKEKWQ